MDIINKFMDSLVNQFTGYISVGDMVLSMVVAFLLALFIILIYRRTFTGIVYTRSFTLCLIMLAMVTTLIIRTVNSNLTLSLGMVGALGLARFRTAVKEPVDTTFMFWAIAIGIMSGAGLYIPAIIGSLALGLLYYVSYTFSVKNKSPYLLVVVYTAEAESGIMNCLVSIKKKRIKSKSINDQHIIEITYEIEYGSDTEKLMASLQAINGVQHVNLITYQNDFGV